MWFDTRSGYQDTGPYDLGDGRVLLLRAMHKLGPSDFAWSGEVARDMPYGDMLAAFVLDGVHLRVTDFGTSLTEPDDYLSRVRAFALFDTSGGALEAVPRAAYEDLRGIVKRTQKDLYRRIAAMERRSGLYGRLLKLPADLAHLPSPVRRDKPPAIAPVIPLHKPPAGERHPCPMATHCPLERMCA